jgi:uncharacterized protein (TIGR03437 family)
MIRKRKILSAAVIAVAACDLAFAQSLPTADLTIDVANVVEYRGDIADVTKFARNSNVTPAIPVGTGSAETPNFALNTGIGDIVAVNGQPAKGLLTYRARAIGATPAPTPGRAIADVTRLAIREDVFEVLSSDGTPVGSIMTFGLSGGAAPPGQASTEAGNWAIVGGTGAFLGARGQAEGAGNNPRAASMAEDPSYRRTNGGGPSRYFLHIIPMTAPRIVTTDKGAAVVHSSDFSLVTPSKPATADEVLSLFASGLGPTVPRVGPGQAFPSDPLAAVNSPVTVTVNGKPSEVLAAVGYPGAVDAYQVNFRVPPDTAKGAASIQVSAAWIAGTPVSITVQ